MWGALPAFGPSSAVYIEGKTLTGKKTIDDLWDYAAEIIASTVLIRNVNELNEYINRKIGEKHPIIESFDEDKIRNDLDKINEMGTEYANRVKMNLKRIIDSNEFLKKKFSNIKF